MSHQVEISYLSLPEALQDIFVKQRTGVLMVTREGHLEPFIALAGQLYLSGSNPCRDELERVLLEPPADEMSRFDAREYLQAEMRKLVLRLGETLASWSGSEPRFSEVLGEVPENIVGPLPTSELVMDVYSRGWALEDLLRRLGGRGARYRAVEDERFRRRVPGLDAAELALLRRLERAATVEQLLADGSETLVIACRLVRLTAVGLVELQVEQGSRDSTVSRQVQQRILEKVKEDLEREPLELEPDLHRRQIGDRLRDYGRLGFFDLLEVDAGASTEKIHASFMRIARLAHPMHADALGLENLQRKLEWLFARLTEAYLVLSDPERSAEYRRGAGIAPPPPSLAPDEKGRRSERAQLAKESYRTALDYIEEEDYFYAIEMLGRAILMDPRPEYYALLGRCQMQNPKWLHMAIDSIRRALALRPEDEELRAELAEATQRYRSYQQEVERAGASPKSEAGRVEARARRLLSKLRRDGS